MAPGETTPWRRKGWAKRKKSTAASAVLKPPKEDGGDFPFAIFLDLVLALPAGFGSSGWPDR